jgi:uncharacterized membrane protein
MLHSNQEQMPGANLTTASYVQRQQCQIFNATSSLVRFKNTFFLYNEKTLLLGYFNAGVGL